MLPQSDLFRLQREQHKHDLRNHFDILSLHKADRLKHYGLHFAKYVGRIARGESEPKPLERTVVDTALVSLSAANTLMQNLGETPTKMIMSNDIMVPFAEASGRFADACEKIDHLEEFVPQARQANSDVMSWVITIVERYKFDLSTIVTERRGELRKRAFYIED